MGLPSLDSEPPTGELGARGAQRSLCPQWKDVEGPEQTEGQGCFDNEGQCP